MFIENPNYLEICFRQWLFVSCVAASLVRIFIYLVVHEVGFVIIRCFLENNGFSEHQGVTDFFSLLYLNMNVTLYLNLF